MSIKSFIIAFLLFSISFVSFSQETIEETKEIADKLFEDEKYIEATPYYLRLLALEPRDHNFNYRYGACLLHNAGKTQDVFKYLNYAITNSNVEKEANYFLGKAYHYNYQFNDAIKYYQIYKTKAGSKPKSSFEVGRQIAMCQNGKKLITTITEMMVLDKKEIEKDKFFRIYDLNDIGGNLLVTAEFQTKLDQKKNHTPLIHFPENPNVIYYSSYGDNLANGKDIYVQRRLPTGGWGLPQVLKGGVNTKYDEDYPYMHPDGKYLYFSSKGHNSMGGYDVFRCMYDAETDMFGLAENMDFAVSSPKDDLFYVVDSLNANAFFGSNRESSEGKLHVYKVRVDRVPLNMTVIKGNFSSEINPQMKKVWIDVTDYSNGEFIGNFSSNEKGVYLITFPKGGKYEFKIRVGESPQEYKYLASIPFQKEFKPLKQKMVHALIDEVENVKVIDLFDESVENPQAVFAKVIKMKSVLKPNVSQEELDRIEKEKRDKEILKELGFDNLSLVEFGYLLDDEIEDARRAENGTKDLENKLYAQVIDYTDEIKRLDGVIQRQLAKAEEAKNDRKKFRTLKYAEKALKNQAALKKLSDEDLAFADSLSKIESSGSAEKTAEVIKYVEGFKALLKENKQQEAYSYLADNRDFLESTIKEKSLDPLQALVERSLVLDEEIARFQPIEDGYDRDIKLLDAKIEELERSKSGAKKKEIEEIDAEISSKKNERALIEDEKNFNAIGLNKAKEERSKLRKQIDALEAVYTYNTDRIVTKQEAENAFKTSNVTDSEGLLSGVLGQLDELIANNPAIKAVDYADLEEELGNIVSNTRQRSESINNDPNLTDAQKAERLKELDKELYSSIKDELKKAERDLRSNPSNEDLKKKYEALQMAKMLVATALDIPEDEEDSSSPIIAATLRKPSSGNSASSPSSVVNSGNASSSSSNQRPTRTNNNDLAVNNINTNNPNSANTLTPNSSGSSTVGGENKASDINNTSKINNNSSNPVDDATINSVADNADDNVTSNVANLNSTLGNKDITSNDNISADIAISPLDAKGKSDLISSINPSYNANIEAINQNSSLSELQKNKEIQKIDEALFNSVKESIVEQELNIKNNPTDNLSRQKLSDLKSIQGDLQSDISLRNAAIQNNITTPLAVKPLDARGKQELIETVNPFYNEKLAQIKNDNSLTEVEKAIQLQKLDESLLVAVNNEINRESDKVGVNPEDNSAIERLSHLKTVKENLLSDISARKPLVDSSLVATSPSNNLANANLTNKEGDVSDLSLGQTKLSAQDKSTLINSVSPSYNAQLNAVQSNSSLSEVEKLEELQKLDRGLLSNVSAEIAKEQQKESSPVQQKNLENLESVKEELASTIRDRETTISELDNLDLSLRQTKLSAQDKSTLINSVSPSYNAQLNAVQSNSSLSEVEKLEELQKLDRGLLSNISSEITKELQKESSPQQKAKLGDLETVKGDLESSIRNREATLFGMSQPLTEKEKSAIIEGLSPMYGVKMNEIMNNSSLSESEKENQVKSLNQDFLNTLDKEISALENNISNNPDPQLLKELKDLRSIREDIISKIEGEYLLSKKDVKILGSAEKSSLIESINPFYDDKVKQIVANNSLSDSEKNSQLIQQDKGLLSAISRESKKVEELLSQNPSSAINLKKREDLISLKADIETTLSEREQIASSVAVNNDSNSGSDNASIAKREAKEKLIAKIDPSYTAKVNAINNNSSLSEVEKLNQLQLEDKELLEIVENKITSTSDEDKSTLATLNQLKAETNSNIIAREALIASSHEPLDKELKSNLIKDIDSKYQKNLEKVEKDNTISVNEKMNQLQELDFNLIMDVEKAIQEQEEAVAKSSEDKIEKEKLSNLNDLKYELESDIAKRESVLASNNNVLSNQVKNDLINSVSSSYAKKVKDIQSNEYLLDDEKAEKLQELDKGLITSLKSEISKLETKDNLNSMEERRLEGLKTVLSEKEAGTAKRSKLISPTNNRLSEKLDLIKTVDPNYANEVESINNNVLISSDEKLNQLQEVDEKLLVKIEKDLKSATSMAKKKSASQEEIKRKSDLEELKEIAEEVISDRKNQIENVSIDDVSNEEKQKIIKEVRPEYKSTVDEISTSNKNDFEKMEALLEEEKALVNDLAIKKSTLEASVKNSPKKEDIANELKVVTAALNESKLKVEDIQQQAVTLKAQRIDQTELITKVDPSFDTDIATILSGNSTDKSEKLAIREKQLQEKINQQISSNEGELSSKDDLTLLAENQLLVQKVKESKRREESYQNGIIEISEDEDENSTELQALRQEMLKDNNEEVLAIHSDIDALKKQKATLTIYNNDLLSSLTEVEKAIEADPTDVKLKERQRVLSRELTIVEEKSIMLSEKIDAFESSSPVAQLTSPELKKLMAEESDLEAQLNNPNLSKKERSKLEKELEKVKNARMTEQNELMTSDIANRKKNNSSKTRALKQTASASEMAKATAELATSQSNRLSSEADELLKQSDKAKKADAKNELLVQATEKQAEADRVVQMALEQNATSVAIADKVNTLDSKEELIAKKEAYENQLGEIDEKIEVLEGEISGMKAKKAIALVEEKKGLESDKKLIQKQLTETERLIDEIEDTPLTVDEKVLEQPITLNEEKEIIASKDYLEYSISANKAIRLENQISEEEKNLLGAQKEAKDAIAKSLDKSNNVSENQIQQSIDKVKAIEDGISTLREELKVRQEKAENILASNSSKADKMKNLLKRGVEPEFNETLAIIEQQRTPAEGLTISDSPVITYSEENPIPVGVKLPSGLVYRVQVGAFSKPIEQDMYNKFSPISGEKLSNGITRYMAGFFNNISSVEEAQGQVKTIGYEDAFIVAYCDNERITISEARRLEASGQCISTSSPDFAIALSSIPESKPVSVDDLSYNKAPGAAKAIPAESKLGLFYTVQVGVYNKPSTSKQLKDIRPLVSKRLDNGQIRYSSGMFTSIESAKPKKSDARARGIKDAFITAYFKGERISLSEASKLLKENGSSILEKVDDFVANIEDEATPTDESVTYNKAPGSVPAKATEAHTGLFFTVQIGVYSKPVTNNDLNNVTPLITKKLENGQMRYSSGMFKSIEDASVKRTEVLQKGVKHAYVTAYYEGKRITLAEARALLIQFGNSILEIK